MFQIAALARFLTTFTFHTQSKARFVNVPAENPYIGDVISLPSVSLSRIKGGSFKSRGGPSIHAFPLTGPSYLLINIGAKCLRPR